MGQEELLFSRRGTHFGNSERKRAFDKQKDKKDLCDKRPFAESIESIFVFVAAGGGRILVGLP